MNKLALVASTLISLSAFAAGPGDLATAAEQRIRSGVEACGLQYLDGQDPQLDYQIRARRVDFVIVQVKNGVVRPGVLVDYNQDFNQWSSGQLNLSYTRTNGSVLLTISRDHGFNDLSVDVYNLGRVAFSNTSWHGTEVVSRYYVRGNNGRSGDVEVGADAFANYINSDVADSFAGMVCRDASTF